MHDSCLLLFLLVTHSGGPGLSGLTSWNSQMVSSQPRRSPAGCQVGSSYPSHLTKYCHRPLLAFPKSITFSKRHSSVSTPSSVRTTSRPLFALTSSLICPGMSSPPRYCLTIDTWKVLKIFMLTGSRSATACDDAFNTSNGPSYHSSSLCVGQP